MAQQRAPKQWSLTKNETITSFEAWRQNLMYILSLDGNFAPFIAPECTWRKKSAASPLRGLTDDGDGVPAVSRKTAATKNIELELMLGQIANFCPIISRNSIVRSSTSLPYIWQAIREHYGFQSTGAHFLDLADIVLQPGEKPQDLYQRLMAFFEDNLITTNGGIAHYGAAVDVAEDLTPTIENTVVFLWLQRVNPGLPALVKQKYAAELRHQTLASLKPEISIALDSLLDDIRSIEDTKVLRMEVRRPRQPFGRPGTVESRKLKSCILCKTAGRPHTSHYLRECSYLPEEDRRRLPRSRPVETEDDDFASADTPDIEDVPTGLLDELSVNRVSVVQSPYLAAYCGPHSIRLTLDTGATSSYIRASLARELGLPVKPASQVARQADGSSTLDVVGETRCTLTHGEYTFRLDALVVKRLEDEVLAGNSFLAINDIALRPAKKQIVVQGRAVIPYGDGPLKSSSACRAQSYILRSTSKSVLLPGDYLQLPTPDLIRTDSPVAIEPHVSTCVSANPSWPKVQEILPVANTIRLLNDTDNLITISKNQQLCLVRSIVKVDDTAPPSARDIPVPTHRPTSKNHAAGVSIDPDGMLPVKTRQRFADINRQYDHVFDPNIPLYNGASGKVEGVVNIGPTKPPQRKGRLPSYNRERMLELQNKFNELETAGVLSKPEDVGVHVEYLNLTFLVKKPDGGSRLVTSFGEVGRFTKPQPSLMPNVDNILREIGRWRYLIKTDLLKSFYQIPLSQASMKYCGVATPYRGIRVYDPGPGFVALVNDPLLHKHGIWLNVGHVKNVNKNPVAEYAIIA